MRRFKIRFNGTEFTANEDALVQIMNLSSSKDEFYVINEENPEDMLDSFTEWKYEDTQPLAIVVDGKIELKSQKDKMQEYMWQDIINDIAVYVIDELNSDAKIEGTIIKRKVLVDEITSRYKIEKR